MTQRCPGPNMCIPLKFFSSKQILTYVQRVSIVLRNEKIQIIQKSPNSSALSQSRPVRNEQNGIFFNLVVIDSIFFKWAVNKNIRLKALTVKIGRVKQHLAGISHVPDSLIQRYPRRSWATENSNILARSHSPLQLAWICAVFSCALFAILHFFVICPIALSVCILILFAKV